MANVTSLDTPSLVPGLPDRLHSLAADKLRVAASEYMTAAAITLFLYDIVLTLPDEIELVWRRTMWTFPALLYLVNRYVTLVCLLLLFYEMSPFRSSLSNSQSITTVGFCVGVASWGGIMSLRATALWKANKALICGVWFAWGCMVITMTVGTVYVYLTLLPTMSYDPTIGICTSTAVTHLQSVGPAVQAAFVLGLTFLTILKAYQFPSSLHALWDMSCVMRLLLHDGVIYFAVVTLLSVISGISWLFLPPSTASNKISLFAYLNWSIFSVIVARLFLRLRKIFYGSYMTSALSPNSYYSTTPQWNILPMNQIIEQDASRFFQDDEFAVISMFDLSMEAPSFVLAPLDTRSASLHPLSREGTIEDDLSVPLTRPSTRSSSLSCPVQSSRLPTTWSNRTRPQTATSTRPNTAPSSYPFGDERSAEYSLLS